MLNPIEKFKRSILHLNRSLHHWGWKWFPGSVEPLLGGGVYAPCSIRHFIPFSLLHSIFRRSPLFTNFHCSFFISLCSLFLFNFSSCSLIISLAPCPISQFISAPCSLFQICVLPAPRIRCPSSLLPSFFMPCSLLPWVSWAILPAPWLPLTGVQCYDMTRVTISTTFWYSTAGPFLSKIFRCTLQIFSKQFFRVCQKKLFLGLTLVWSGYDSFCRISVKENIDRRHIFGILTLKRMITPTRLKLGLKKVFYDTPYSSYCIVFNRLT